jgi:broad specificity phosphatase PhoE
MYGLAPSGVLQAKAAGTTLAKELEGLSISPDCVSIYASPFSRTTQTAQAVADVLESSLGTKPSIQLMEELRERYFGPSLELQSHEHVCGVDSKPW